tara:strand:- start:357 stop:596 length:240 start_codon:yes stop_codon:yes gene_type:complete
MKGTKVRGSTMDTPLVPAEEPVVEPVLEWTIRRDAEDIRTLMGWITASTKRREREALIVRTRELLAEIEHAAQRLDELR